MNGHIFQEYTANTNLTKKYIKQIMWSEYVKKQQTNIKWRLNSNNIETSTNSNVNEI